MDDEEKSIHQIPDKEDQDEHYEEHYEQNNEEDYLEDDDNSIPVSSKKNDTEQE